MANKSNIIACISNPCFEVWFLLHFSYSTRCLNVFEDVKMELLKYMPDYEKNKDVYHKLQPYQDKAIMNAKKLESHHKNEGKTKVRDCNPSTRVHELVEYLDKLT